MAYIGGPDTYIYISLRMYQLQLQLVQIDAINICIFYLLRANGTANHGGARVMYAHKRHHTSLRCMLLGTSSFAVLLHSIIQKHMAYS